MKIINSVVVFMIVVCGSQLSHGVKLDCEFKNFDFGIGGSLYSCDVTSFDNPHNNLNIEGYSGEHLANKNDADIKAIWIHDTNTKYIPANLGSLFNLIVLRMEVTLLIEIKAKDFLGMQDLEEISFYNNKLTSVPLDAFATLTKLKIISLSSNQIEELPNGIFKNNLELEEIYLWKNKIKILGTEIFHDLKKLNYVGLRNNICVNKEYKEATEITLLKDDIKLNCTYPNAIENKIINEISELRIEVTKAKDVQQKDRIEIEKLKIEQNKLKQDLLEAKKMNERIPKMEHEIYDLNKKISDIEEQRRMERSAFIEVKFLELKRAIEQLTQLVHNDNPGM